MRATQKAEHALPRTGCTLTQGAHSEEGAEGAQSTRPPSPLSLEAEAHRQEEGVLCVRTCVQTSWWPQTQQLLGGSATCNAASRHVPDEAALAAGGLGAYRRAEVAAAGAALVLHHPAPVVLTQHQERRLAGRAHQLVLDHAVCAPAQLQSDNTRVSNTAACRGSADASPGRTLSSLVGRECRSTREDGQCDGVATQC